MGEISRVLAISNRLPVTTSNVDGKYTFQLSSGGLVSALSSLKNLDMLWLGWPGIGVPEKEQKDLTDQLRKEYRCVPVYLNDELADLYYNGFSNSILWPLFHYHPGEMAFDDDSWDAYVLANREFARAVAKVYRPGDMIWVHDYHLMILPAMIREELANVGYEKDVMIAFFLHIPFPSSEIYRVLPVRLEVLLGVLQSDLIGFHTYDYVRHFLSSVSSLLRLHTTPVGVEFQNRFVSVGVFPIGIDPDRFLDTLKLDTIRHRIGELKKHFAGKKIMLGIDRLDYIKGLPHKFNAFNIFLNEHPEWIGKVLLVQVAVPSRQDVEEYQNLRAVVNELVGRINGKFGSVDYTPIHYMHRSVDFHELVCLYALADVCIVSSTRDGMNLVAYEYVICQEGNNGQLILSEFTGAAQSLNGSLIVNPWNMEEMSEAYNKALTCPESKCKANHDSLFKHVTKFTTEFWANSIVKEMRRIAGERKDGSSSPSAP